ncbi:carotenoid oxygenase family protein [Actinomycetes bacterium KLBMP 9797]
MTDAPVSRRAETDHRLGFRTLGRELTGEPLTVRGSFPGWLAGDLLRTGPARFEVGEHRYRHWFDGLAMLHRFAFAGGEVRYWNRYVDSPAYRSARDTGRIAYSEFATDPCRSLFRRLVSAFRPPSFGDNANVNVLRFGEEFLAMSETPLPVVFDPDTLGTLGVAAAAPGQLTVAHPHLSPATGELVSYATHFGPSTRYRIYTRAAGATEPRVIATLPAPRPAYMHSFAITERYVVLVEFPFVAVPAAIPLSGRPFIENYRWKPKRGTTFRVVELATGRELKSYRAAPFFAFHHVNAFEQDGELVVDLCAYDDVEVVRALYMERLLSARPRVPGARLHRYALPLDGGDTVRAERLGAVGVELPRIDYARRNGRPYRYVYGVGARNDGDFPNQIVKVDVARGDATVWWQPDSYPGEPVFVRTPGNEREDGGVLLSVVLDPAAGASFLLVLDATNMAELARALVPHSVPFGFHGTYIPTQMS